MVKIYRAAIVGRLDHDDVVLETDHLAEIATLKKDRGNYETIKQSQFLMRKVEDLEQQVKDLRR